MNELGYHRIVLKTDQENPITDLQAEVRRSMHKEIVEIQEQVRRNGKSRSSTSMDIDEDLPLTELLNSSRSEPQACSPIGCEIVLENSPVGESQANGLVERAIQEFQGHIRV